MKRSLLCKLVQRQTYDILSQKHLFALCLVGLLVIGVSAYRFSEIAFKWSRQAFNIFSDNISRRNLQTKLCQSVPIDAVYTWVNGSDPEIIRNLTLIKHRLLLENNKSSTSRCKYKLCIPSPIVVLLDRKDENTRIANVLHSFPVNYSTGKEEHTAATALVFNSQHTAAEFARSGYVTMGGKNITASRAYVTGDQSATKGVMPLQQMLLLAGISDVSQQAIFLQLARLVGRTNVSRVYLYENESMALVLTPGKAASEALRAFNFTTLGRHASLLQTALILEANFDNEDLDTSRFADNDELKYSLRSLEKNAPWVRRLFLVTNGQIPSWLNLHNEKISIVTHEEIFANHSHLPTYSSPAIETHLHRIPGLSKRFIYLNDDVMFGKQVWPEDFYSHSHGYKIRLAWSVPDCAVGCPISWIRDGYCDRPCNNSRCQWDGGDCKGGQTSTFRSPFAFPKVDVQKMYCSSSCANSWLADRYCDQACNVLACAFDAGDCGLSSYHLLHGIPFDERVKDYFVPAGKAHVYFNLSALFRNDSKVTDGHYQDNEDVRTLAVSLQHKVLTVVLRSRQKPTRVHIVLKGINKGLSFELPFVVHLNASTDAQHSLQSSLPATTTTTEVPLVFTEFHQRYPIVLPDDYTYDDYVDVEKYSVPDDLREQLEAYKLLYTSGKITLKGLRRKQTKLIRNHLNNETLKEDNKLTRRLLSTVEEVHRWRGRRLLDTFGDSLRHVNQLYNDAFGFEARKVPSHMAHIIDRDIVERLQARFPEEFDKTSSHQIRSPDDMQFAFSYFYFLMSEIVEMQVEEIFDLFDVDTSGTWSDREIRTVVATLNNLPLEYRHIREVEELLIGCEKNATHGASVSTPAYERYSQSALVTMIRFLDILAKSYKESFFQPTISKELVINCDPLVQLLKKTFKTKHVNPFETIKEDDYAFIMLQNNVSLILAQMDQLRKSPKKFICLNDNIDHSSSDAEMVKAVVRDLYESLFPTPSSFELAPEYRNRFSRVHELRAWQRHRNVLGVFLTACFLFLLAFTLVNLYRASCRREPTIISRL